ncbi:hypothetical protein KQI63_07540 [bacterium]|nr:hypothetical protein [bacterium]
MAEIVLVCGIVVLIFATGFWLTRMGRPPQIWLVTIHKLLVLAGIFYFNILFFRENNVGGDGWTTMVAMNLGFVAAIASGSMLTAQRDWPRSIQILHRVTPWITAGTSLLMLYFIGW